MKIVPIHCLTDNYAYLLICRQTGHCAVVDPSEAAPVIKVLTEQQKKQDLQLVAILNTHHHWDHVGGNEELKSQFPDIKIYAHASDKGRIAGQTEFLEHGDRLQIGNLEGSIVHNPGHTSGAISYAFGDALFTGDTLFGGGCGRVFEGTPSQMYHSLNQVIGSFADETKIYFGHEYTVNNLRFAMSVETDNPDIRQRAQRAVGQRGTGKATSPSTLGEERLTNPFLRCDHINVIESLRRHDPGLGANPEPAEVFRVLRSWKDRF